MEETITTISRVSSRTEILDSNTEFGGERGECSRREAQHRGTKKARKESQWAGTSLSHWSRWSETGRWSWGEGEG